MKGTIVNYRGGRHTQKPNQLVVHVEGVKTKEDSKKLMKKKAVWTTPGGNKINGEVSKTHGGKGQVLVKFEKGLPGQALGTELEIVD
ncbi:MAG: 50S ribosomal protein L35ae [Candidatus Altiarchaeota archaeon]